MSTTTSTAGKRPFEVEDLFELEDVGMYSGGPYAWSPDGTQLALTRVRPKKTWANQLGSIGRRNTGLLLRA